MSVPNYHVWEIANGDDTSDFDDGQAFAASDHEDAAEQYADADTDAHNTASPTWELVVQDLATGERYNVRVSMDWSPSFYASTDPKEETHA